MWAFFADLVRNVGTEHTIVMMDTEEVGKTRRYRIYPSRMLTAWGGSLLVAGIIVGVLLAFTPLRTQIPGYGTETIERSARLNTMRLRSLQDSLAAQRQYIRQLRQLITGQVDSLTAPPGSSPSQPSTTDEPSQPRSSQGVGGSAGQRAHEPPAIDASVVSASRLGGAGEMRAVQGLSFPLPSPVMNGFPTRDFSAQTGHYGIDVAVSKGESIRSVGDGYVVWADWTQDGGYTVAVQHADGYLSVYKHNGRLLKRIGERVRAAEPIAVSGNTGAITTGPHLHFELWRNGLAQSPRSYVTGW